MFCSPMSLSDQHLIEKIQTVETTILNDESSLCKASPSLAYSQIAERVGDLNRLRNFKRSLMYEAEGRGFRFDKAQGWHKKKG